MLRVDGKVLAHKITIADNLFKRTKGLMFSRELPQGNALIIPRCNAIHTCFMRFPIDVMFLDRDLNVLKIIRNVAPWRLVPPVFGASYVVELPANTLNGEEYGRVEIGGI